MSALTTDLYQLTMAQGYWQHGRHLDRASFYMSMRRTPFGGGFAIAAGLEQIVAFLDGLRFEPEDIDYLRSLSGGNGGPLFAPGFLDALPALDLSVSLAAVPEGTAVFAREPLLRVEAPLLVGQLIETPILNIINFQTLVATKAARLCHIAAPGQPVLEFGLRRAQGFDGALSACRAAYVGGCTATSNVQAGQRFGPGHAFQTAISHQAADDRAVLLLDPRLVVLPIRPRPRQLDVVLLAEADQHLVEKLAAVVGVDPPQRKREGAAEPIHRVDHHTCFTHQQRYGLRPAAGDIGQHQRPDEAAGHRRATVRDQVGLDEARRRILPIAERAHRNPAPYALAPGTTAPTLTGRHRPRRREAAVYRRGADRHELLAHLRVQGQVPMPLECRHQDRQQRLQALPAHTV